MGTEEDLYGGMSIYQRPGEDLTFGGAELESIRYFFWHDQLLDVTLKFRGDSNQRKVLRACKEQFGPDQGQAWDGPRAIISFQYQEADHEGRLDLMSKGVLRAAETFERARLTPRRPAAK